ncbi:ribonuclease R [Aestuariivirga sp. YIM B02566]|uniref:Ribonuclease R n=1 Tax=Taklimakanibacter albus TaxID=2800327 RepID=A0ACC5R1G8_9HYPH|nr:ribonuclease R [Aestuariivirga sp. YIM B02566]
MRKAVARKAKQTSSDLPTAEQLIDFIKTSPGKVGKREIARAFNIKGNDRIALKRQLKELEQDGKLKRAGRVMAKAGELPPITVVEITGRDANGELLAVPAEWEMASGEPPQILIIAQASKGTREESQPPAMGDRVLARLEPTKDPKVAYHGRVIRKIAGRSTRVLGIFRHAKGHGARVVPVDKKARHELQVQPGHENGAEPGELVSVEVMRGRGHGLPTARVKERLGDISSQRNISLIAIEHHGIPSEFPARVLAEADALKPFSHAHRTDLRDIPLVTIDPPDARDHDDAVWAEPDDDPKNEGGVKVIVAIADVSTYVQSGSALDREARIRGNSVYFPDRVVPMLPERISNDLCSLREREERPCLAVFMTFDRSGTKRKHHFVRGVMRSVAKLSYQQAQAAIDGRPDDKTETLLAPVLRPLWAAYKVLLKGRNRREPLELDLPERKLILDAHGLIERVVTPERLDAHKLIEEFMIQANVAAAETLGERKIPLLYRVHANPAEEKIRSLGEFLKTVGINLAKGQHMTPRHFNQILKEVEGKDYQHVVNEVVLRTQAQAVYDTENAGHFGLHLRHYAHFTSPIRRYADLIVHRALITAFGFGSDGLSSEDTAQLSDTATLVSGAERRAMAAERETVDRLIASHLSSQIGARFPGRIGGVVSAGLFITLNDTGADGFIPAGTLGSDYFVYDETRRALIGERSGETFQLGDKVDVRLVEAAPVSGGLRFEMMSDGRKGKPVSRRSLRVRGPARGKRR